MNRQRITDKASLLVVVAIAVIVAAGPVAARQPAPASLPSQAREYDFWLGSWNVNTTSGPGTNNITAFGPGGGIAILEDYRQTGYRGTSVSYYSPRDGEWRQLWLDSPGGLLEFAGQGLQGERFVIEGQVGATKTRLVYSQIRNNTLEFDYDLSTNDGATWVTSFEASYTRTGPARPPSLSQSRLAGRVLPASSRQFDFLLGGWNVIAASGQPVTSEVYKFGEGGGIAVLEKQTGEDGYELGTVWVYHVQARSWNMLSLDTNGVLMDLKGGLTPSGLVLTGTIEDPRTGLNGLARARFVRTSADEVDVTFEVSRDGGQTWEPGGVSHYNRGALSAPDNFRATKVKKKKVEFAWDDTSSTETGFELLRKDGEEWTVLATVAPDTTTATVKGLQRSTQYVFGIRVCDPFGCSEPTEITVTTR